CTYVGACNYNPDADVEDGSCLFPPVGCPWPDNSASVGCTYSGATNFSGTAIWDDGSCIWPPSGDDCPTDVNEDGMTNVTDVLAVLGSYGQLCLTPIGG
ncbi:MAG: hypothetical protein ACPF8Y_09380, partial [Flavobacteriales bacterium]